MERKQNLQFDSMELGGLWGCRVKNLIREWSLKVNNDLLLDGFRSRPGLQAWIGEHIGKYVDGAVSVNAIAHSQALADKIHFLIRELTACQDEDGYLGTYLPETRWGNIGGEENCGWDPWVAKYCLIGLYADYRVSGNEANVTCARRVISLMNSIYGVAGTYNLNRSDIHAGLASGSVLEPLMLWYELTGQPEAKALADHIVNYCWGENAPGTPHLLKNMNELPDGLRTVGRGKAYEMMSCFVGLVEYARQTDHAEFLDKVILARDQIALYYRQLSGCMSEREWFSRASHMTESAELENCVAFTWIQLNSRLFELTGDMRCIDYIEETAFNHIMQAISPDSSTWIYYSTLVGPKNLTYWSQLPSSDVYKGMMSLSDSDDPAAKHDYTSAPVTCCTTNGQRVLGLTPQYACTLSHDGDVYINLLFDMEKMLRYGDNTIEIRMHTDFPRTADGSISICTQKPCKVFVRIPHWASSPTINGVCVQPGTYFSLDMDAGKGTIKFCMPMCLRLLSPGFDNRGKIALAYGPLLMAVDSLPDGWTFDEIALELPEKLSAVQILTENGWPCLELGARHIPNITGELNYDEITKPGQARVTLRPYMFCGFTADNREYAQRYDEQGLTYDRNGKRTEYRVMVPFFFVK